MHVKLAASQPFFKFYLQLGLCNMDTILYYGVCNFMLIYWYILDLKLLFL